MPNLRWATLDYESLAALKSMLGSGAIIVFHEETCIVWTIYKLIHFFRITLESCLAFDYISEFRAIK